MLVDLGWILLVLVLFGLLSWIFYTGFREVYLSRKREDEDN